MQPTDDFILTASKALFQAHDTASNPNIGFRNLFQAQDTKDDAFEGYFKKVSIDGICAPTSLTCAKIETCLQCCTVYSIQSENVVRLRSRYCT